jgi:PAS domain S-box-containing protein
MNHPPREKPIEILLVEDSPSDALLLCEALRSYPPQQFEIAQAERLADALALVAAGQFDVILLDLNLPDSRGMETCERMSRAAGQVPIIVLTGADDEAAAAEAMHLGVQDYLVKGQTQGGVIGRTIRYAVERSRTQRALHAANERLQQQAEELQSQAEEQQAQTEELTTANEELRKSERALHKEKAISESTIESLPGVFYLFDSQGRYLKWNKGLERVSGYTGAEIARMHPLDFFAGPDRALIEQRIQEVFTKGQSSAEAELVTRDGHRIPFFFTGLATTIGETHCLIGMGVDITDRKRAEEALRAANEQLRQQTRELQARTDMLGVVNTALQQSQEALRRSHDELEGRVRERTAELLRANEQLGLEMAERERAQEALEHRAQQLQKLTLELSEAEERERKRLAEILHDDLQQVLAAAKFHLSLMKNRTKHDPLVQASAAQIDQMLKDAIEESRGLSHELSPAVLHHGDFAETLGWLAAQVRAKHGLEVRVEARGEVKSQSDTLKAFLYRATQELLFNVVKHARVHEARIRVRRLGRYICLSVSDRGRGFDPQETRETTGFGLFSIRERVALLGGRMRIKSAKGRGATFHIVMPEGEPCGDGAPPEARESRRVALGRPVREEGDDRLRVLLVDDHEIVRQGVASLLSEEPSVRIVGEATNGREAVDLANELRPDVVVMDVSMPLMNGDEATRQIKRYLPRTRVVALSMHEQTETVENMRRAGADSYVLKTAPSEELLAAIRGRQTDE